MSYIKKYSFPFATKFEQDAVLELWEDTADLTVYEFTGVSFQIQYIPSSDDPFEAIYATQLAVTIDVTDDTTGNTSANIPNLVTLNDRKYLAKLFIDGNQIFSGWTLSDSISLSFSTGRKELSFNCVDGLAILKDIKFSNGIAFDNNISVPILIFIINCLKAIEIPIGLNIVTSVTYFAEGMLTKADGLQYEPFAQTYVFGNSFLDSDGEYESCYDVLEKILRSFGARIIQANNKWYIHSINQFAQDTRYEVEYYWNGTLISYGTNILNLEITPYSNTANFYFIDNSQTKLLKKGYNNIISDNQIEFASNYLFNGNLKYLVAGYPDGWTKTVTGGGVVNVVNYAYLNSNAFEIQAYTGTAMVLSSSLIYIGRGNKPKVKFTVNMWDFTTAFAAKLILIITNGTSTYYLDANANWVPMTGTPDYYKIPASDFPPNALEVPKDYTFTANPVPFGGELQFGIYISSTIGKQLIVNQLEVGIESLFNSVLIESRLTDTEEYTLKMDSPLGVPSNYLGYQNFKGYLMTADGLMARNWYRYEYPVEVFRGLAQLLVRQYMNVYQKNIINLDCNLSSINATNGIVNGQEPIKVQYDNDPASINVEESYYMFGNTTMDLYNDTIQSTLLQISNVNVEGATIETTYNNGDTRGDFPEGCVCWALTGVYDNASYSYTDCNGVDHFGYLNTAETIYVPSANEPLIEGTTAVMVDPSYCSL